MARERAVARRAAQAESAATTRATAMRRALKESQLNEARTPAQASQGDARIDTVDVILATQDTALAWAHVRIAALDTALELSEVRAGRADSLLHVVVRQVEQRCRIAWVVPCPSRRVAAVMGAVGAFGVVAVLGR